MKQTSWLTSHGSIIIISNYNHINTSDESTGTSLPSRNTDSGLMDTNTCSTASSTKHRDLPGGGGRNYTHPADFVWIPNNSCWVSLVSPAISTQLLFHKHPSLQKSVFIFPNNGQSTEYRHSSAATKEVADNFACSAPQSQIRSDSCGNATRFSYTWTGFTPSTTRTFFSFTFFITSLFSGSMH